MFDPIMMLAALMSLLALCGVLALRYGWDSRDDFADQAHRAPPVTHVPEAIIRHEV